MRCELIAVGTELLLGQIVDTNSSWMGEQLALTGIDSHYQSKVGDNPGRIREVLERALERSDAVIMCGGLGPTQDDLTRPVIAEVMGVDLVRDPDIVARIEKRFGNRPMPQNNLLQADVPVGATAIPVMPGTAPGLMAPVGDKVIYAVPGVPWEMKAMMNEFILPNMQERAGITAVIQSRTLRTWGQSESGLAEMLADEITRIDNEGGGATIAFLASGIEGLKVRLTAKADTEAEVQALLDEQEARVRAILGDDLIFGLDDTTMEAAVLQLLDSHGLSLGLAESLTGGLMGARITSVPGASSAFQGSIVSYASEVKFDVLGVPEGPVVSEDAVTAMVQGACRVLGADVGVAVTGVAGPGPQDGLEPGTVWFATMVDGQVETQLLNMPFDRDRVRQFTVITSLNALRLRLVARAAAG